MMQNSSHLYEQVDGKFVNITCPSQITLNLDTGLKNENLVSWHMYI